MLGLESSEKESSLLKFEGSVVFKDNGKNSQCDTLPNYHSSIIDVQFTTTILRPLQENNN